jgi:hypothetical protein
MLMAGARGVIADPAITKAQALMWIAAGFGERPMCRRIPTRSGSPVSV